jgi:hypothetical protein
VIQLVELGKIEHARRILSGEERSRVHVQGAIVKEAADYNPGWSFHLSPESIDFFEIAMEVCDAAIAYVEEHLDEIGGSALPGAHWCPWSSRLVDEVTSKGTWA